MRILILGIDALEYNLIEKFNLEYLRQKEYGKIRLPITEKIGEPATLLVWTSFITGKNPGEYGYDHILVFKEPLRTFMKLFYKVKPRHEHETIEDTMTSGRKLLDTLSMVVTKLDLAERPSRKHINVPTIFDNKNSIHGNIPVYDEDAFPDYRKYTATEAFENPTCRKEYEKGCQREFEERTQMVIDKLKEKDWTLYMQYFFLLDGIQHVFFKDNVKILNYYLMFNEFVGNISRKLPEDVLLLIVSDHGQEKGLHTDYGFYSCNKELNLGNLHMTDFKNIIENIIKEKK